MTRKIKNRISSGIGIILMGLATYKWWVHEDLIYVGVAFGMGVLMFTSYTKVAKGLLDYFKNSNKK